LRYCTQCCSLYTAHVDYCAIDGAPLDDNAGDPLVGRTIDRYYVIEPLGRGGMGCVYRVGHQVLEHEYAMKVLYGDLAADHRIVDRFRLEARSVSRMRHPNVVSVTDFGVSPEGLTFLVMELVHGRTLASMIAESGTIAPKRAGEITRQIAAGLNEAHSLGLIHRDIKPSNIMVGGDATHPLVKILDFGIVSVARGAVESKVTTTEPFIGTPQYMAPEQALGPALLGPPADLYSLGIILFEMLTGSRPFEGTSSMEMLVKHVTEPLPAIPPSEGLELLVRWLLEKSPNKRPQTGAEVIAEIERLRGTDWSDRRPSWPRGPLADTLEMFVDDVHPPEDRRRLLDAIASSTPGRSRTPAPLPPRAAAPQPEADVPIEFEAPVVYQPVNEKNVLEVRTGDVAIAGYEVLREKLERVENVLASAQERVPASELSDLLARYQEMSEAVRPGLRAYRYSDLATKIAQLEDDLRVLRGA
jgi:serine/threonine protein kinase